MSGIKAFLSKLIYGGQVDLLYNKHKRDQDFFIAQAMFWMGFFVLTGGTFLTGFALYMGASDTLTGYIPLMMIICGVFSIFAGVILERIERRKRMVIIFNAIAKLLVVSIVLIPNFLQGTPAIIAMFVMLIGGFGINAIVAVAVNNWFISVVPESIRGRYFSLRQTFTLTISATLPIIAGRFLDSMADKYLGYIILFSVAFLMIIGESLMFSKIDEPHSGHLGKGNIRLRDIIIKPIQNRRFMTLTLTVVVFHLVWFISATFTQVFMQKYLNLSFTFITIMSTGLAICMMLSYRFWGRVYDQRGGAYTMKTAMWFYIVEISIWAFVTKTNMYYLIPLTYFFEAVAGPGFFISSFNLRYKLIPENGRTIYDGFFSAILGITMILAPFLGRLIQNGIVEAGLPDIIPFAQFRLVYGLTAVLVLILQIVNHKGKHTKAWEVSSS